MFFWSYVLVYLTQMSSKIDSSNILLAKNDWLGNLYKLVRDSKRFRDSGKDRREKKKEKNKEKEREKGHNQRTR